MRNHHGQIHIIGGGVAGLAAAVFAIRDAGVPGGNVQIYEEGRDEDSQRGSNTLGGCLDATAITGGGFVMRGGRMFEEHYRCTYDLLSEIPSFDDPNISAKEDIFNFTREAGWRSTARLVDRNCKPLKVDSMGFNWGDRLALARLLLTKEEALDNKTIEDVFPKHFFQTNFWLMWCTMFSFQPWHSGAEMRRYLLRFMHLFPQIADLSCVFHTRFNQYHSMVAPIVSWLAQHGAVFHKGARIADLSFEPQEEGWRVISLDRVDHNESRQKITLGREDIVLVTNGSMTDAATLGSWDSAAPFMPHALSGAWSLWRSLAAKRPDFGHPEIFLKDVDATKWTSFTVVTKAPSFAQALFNLTGRDYGREGLITFPESNWFLTLHPHFQPVFPGHTDKDGFIWWGYGLNPDAQGNYVKKPMAECSGEELLEETLCNLRLDEATHRETKMTSTSIPCMMPFITSQFMPRRRGDRPAVRPAGSKNLAFIGQFAEVEDDVVFTVEYSVRTAKTAIASFFLQPNGKPIEVPPIYRGYHDIGKLLQAGWISIRPAW